MDICVMNPIASEWYINVREYYYSDATVGHRSRKILTSTILPVSFVQHMG